MKKLALILFAGAFLFTGLEAQMSAAHRIPPRLDDQFQKWRLVRRIMLDEKINQPLINGAPMDMYDPYGKKYNQGIVDALMQGFENGDYMGYDPDDLSRTMDHYDMMEKAKRLFPDELEEEEWDSVPDEIGIEIGDPEGDMDPENMSWTLQTDDEEWFDISAFETVIELIEDRIYDKNRSDIVHNIKFIRLVWVDPQEELPDANVICFRYEDVMKILDNTSWINPKNNAADLSMLQALEMRMFNSYVTNVSGKGVRSLSESLYREEQMMEFEHNLYSW